ncbi:pyridoxamine 5'-phosphate oxidase family protein [Sphingomonas sp. 10B4]|uniref:pyridoxamine 5'-phosphate oxidase family protein n=1 Tax=Sphingomonas sp. 10B4 TaxID=3048575 RepID=UPI002AB5B645|nr:pyridoxamine 5'-phosphate oxidase family protein [Sphingomonas sp. 10B4]MDY7524124.1 pyridoxamine 5'-phosphate oxidase family protein [Sphingomonas sp. 10B4]MEB0281742.1 pyridoxamine 5'-phosphate oxidase family protein [Sphingomonas sp. 10B4]
MEMFSAIDAAHRAFIAKQPVFFIATAAAGARVNLSPKGMDSFRVLGPNRVAYLDLGGSGNETQAHLVADGRITIMFCAFDNPALILRLYGTGSFTVAGEPGYDDLAGQFPALAGARQVFDIRVDSVQTSCGWGVPRMTLDRPRDTLVKFHAQQDPDARLAVIAKRTHSIDGLPVRVQTILPAFDPLEGTNGR